MAVCFYYLFAIKHGVFSCCRNAGKKSPPNDEQPVWGCVMYMLADLTMSKRPGTSH